MNKTVTRAAVVLLAGVLLTAAGCANMATARKEKASAHYRMANSYLQQGRGLQDEVNRRKAYGELFKAIQLDPQNADYHLLMGTIYMFNDELIAAEKEIKEALKHDPMLGEAHNNLGLVYLKQGRTAMAIEEFRKAIDNLSYQTPERAYFNLGRASYSMGDYIQAVEAFERTVAILPNYEEARYLLGRSYARLGRLSEAEQAFKELLTRNPDSAAAHFELGVVLFKLQRKEAAASHFERVVQLDPESEAAEQSKTFIKLLR